MCRIAVIHTGGSDAITLRPRPSTSHQRPTANDHQMCNTVRRNSPSVEQHYLIAVGLLSTLSKGVFMFRVIAGLVVCVGLAAVASAQDAKVAKGEQLFVSQKCTLCHSVGDKGNKKGPLDGVASKLKADEIHEWIVDAKGMTAKTKAPRKPEMKAYTLPKDDLDALVAYLVTLKK
jgi:mono/diheme cytochrome c family protein